MPLKIVFEFSQQGEGWSEVYYNSTNDPSAYLVLDDASHVVVGCPVWFLEQVRLALLTSQGFLTWIRVSLVGKPGSVRAVGIPPQDGVGLYSSAFGKPAKPAEIFAKLLMRGEAGLTQRKSFWIGGIPEDVIQPGQTYQPNAQFDAALGLFRTLLTSGTYGIVGRQSSTTPPVATAITAFSISSNGLSAQITPLVQPPGNPLTWYVILRSVKYPKTWGGIHRASVTVGVPSTMTLGPFRTPKVSLPAWDFTSGGTVQALAPPFTGFDRIRADRIALRKVGRPFALPRGRR